MFSGNRRIYRLHDEKDKDFELEMCWLTEENGFSPELVPSVLVWFLAYFSFPILHPPFFFFLVVRNHAEISTSEDGAKRES